VLRLRRYEQISVQNRRFRSNGAVDPKFQAVGVAPTNHSTSQKNRLNNLSYGIKIWTDLSSILSQCTCLTDGRTDRGTDRILIARPRLHSIQRGKNRHWLARYIIGAMYRGARRVVGGGHVTCNVRQQHDALCSNSLSCNIVWLWRPSCNIGVAHREIIYFTAAEYQLGCTGSRSHASRHDQTSTSCRLALN